MRRRQFLGVLGGAATLWPLTVRAQQPGKLPTIGILGTTSASAWGPWTAALTRRLRELGWVEGRNVAIEYRWADGRSERYTEIATEFVQLKVDVIVTSGGAVSAVKRTTSTIPIVFALSADPVGSGLVDSLARPGGNVTGLSGQSIEIGSKKLELLREVVPNLRRLAILVNAKNVNVLPEMRDVQALASALNIEVATFELRQSSDIAPAVEGLKDRVDALYVVVDPFVINNRVRINTLALAARLPTIHGFREGAEASGFMSYGPHFPDQFRRAGDYVDKILRGAKPADLPVQQPTKFELVINLTTARALGLTIPESFILRADEVIE